VWRAATVNASKRSFGVSAMSDRGMKMEMIRAQRPFARWRVARGSVLALALLIAPLAMSGRAEADCTANPPTTPLTNATVTCTGTTTHNPTGFGTADDNNNTYNILARATVTGDRFGIVLGTGGTVNNSGAITGTNAIGLDAGDVTVNNISTSTSAAVISGNNGIRAGILNLNNTGTVTATGPNSDGIDAGTVTVTANSGLIQALAAGGVGIHADFTATVDNSSGGVITGDKFAIQAKTVNVTGNAGTIQANGKNSIAINAGSVNITDNSGTIQATATDGVAIEVGVVGAAATVNNSVSGVITGGHVAIAADIANINNAGLIQATQASDDGIAISSVTANVANSGAIQATGTGGFGISAATVNIIGSTGTISGAGVGIFASQVATVNSSGLIQGGTFGISAGTAKIFDSGTISAGAGGVAISADIANVTNFGTISVTGGGGIGILAFAAGAAATVTNSGTISADTFAIEAVSGSATLTNTRTGMISGFSAIIVNGDATVGNAGTIQATNALGEAIHAGGLADVTSSGSIIGGANGIFGNSVKVTNLSTGTISGNIGVQAFGGGGIGSTITTSGAIISTAGATGTAIKLSQAADTLTLLPGSRIVGVVDMGDIAVLRNDVVNVTTVAPSRKVSSLTTAAALPTFINFHGVINSTFSGGGFNGPSVQAGTQLATLDPTALAQADRTLMDFTGGVSSLVQGRLNGVAPSANGAVMATSYAPEDSHAGPFTKAPGKNADWLSPAPITVWANSFGGQRTQDATNETLRATSTAFGGAIGIDRKLRPDWLVGAFIGGGSGGLSVDLSSQKVDTDYVFAGGYSRFEWAAHFFDFTLQGGNASNKSDRLVLNNLAAGGLERARANYNGWYISPEVVYGFRQDIGNGYVLTPTARVRYVAGFFDGFNETGSAQGLRIGSRTLQDFEERGELDVSRVTTFFGGDHSLKTNLHGGVIALQRAGDANVNAVLIGQNLAFTTPGKGSTVGWVAGAGFDYHTSANIAIFGAVEGAAMSDQSRIVTAKGGVRAAF
jgi:uncharacterized protein with beta-barrel porin domain